MRLRHLHHVQVPYPLGQDEVARQFYTQVLELRELPRPAALAERPGMWLDLGHGQQLHLLAKDTGSGSRDHHIALMVEDLAAARATLRERGVVSEDRPSFPEYRLERCVIRDPFGNRIELVAERAVTE